MHSFLSGWFVFAFATMLFVGGGLGMRALAAPSGHRTRAVVLGASGEPWSNASMLRRCVFTAAGPVGAYCGVVIVLTLAAMSGGVTESDPSRVQVVAGQPAEAAGLRTGDRLVTIAGHPHIDWDDLRRSFEQRRGERVPVVVERDGARVEAVVIPNEQGRIGVTPFATRRAIGPGAALVEGFTMPPKVIAMGVRGLFVARAPLEMSGPVGITREVARATESSWATGLRFAGLVLSYLLWIPVVASVLLFPKRARRLR